MENIYLVMPVYNEEVNIENVVISWYKVIEKSINNFKVVIDDTGSNDNTHNILLELQKQLSNLIMISGTHKEHGPKLISLYKYSIENDANYIFQTDSDGQTNPEEFVAFWNLRNRFDAIIGNRKKREDGILRIIIGKIICIILNVIFGVIVPDANTPFRLMKANLIKKYIYRFKEDYYLPNIMLTTFFSYYNEKLYFKDISFKSRQAGKNTINTMKVLQIGFKVIKEFKEFQKVM